MEVSLAVLADYVVVSHDQKLSILGIFNNINGRQAPGTFPNCFIVIVMELAAVEANREHEVEIRCMDADGAPVFDATGKFVASNVTTGNAIRANHVMQLGPHIQLPRFGDYSISIFVNNDLKKEITFSFMQVQRLEVAGPAGYVGGRGGTMLKTLNYYMTLPYTIDVVYAESGKAPPYVARILELPGCIAQGRSHNEAVRELREAQALFIEAMLESHVPIPEPAYTSEATVTEATLTKLTCAVSIPESHLTTSPPVTSRLIPA